MKLYKDLPRWYDFDTSYNTKKDAEERVRELKRIARKSKQHINVRIMKRNEKFFSVFTYSNPYLIKKK